MFAFIIESVRQAILTGQRVRVLRSKHSLFPGDKATELRVSFPITSLSPQRISEEITAAQSIRMFWTEGTGARLDCALQNGRGLAILPLIDQHISDCVLNFRPLAGIALPVGHRGCFPEMCHCAGVIDSLLRCEPCQLERPYHIRSARRRSIFCFGGSLQREALRLAVVIGNVGTTRPLESRGSGRVFQFGSRLG